MKISFELNGEAVETDVPPMKRLLDVLREDLRLTGTKEGCGEGECGACAVLLDGELVTSCLVPAVQAQFAEVKTVEGLGTEEQLAPLQQAFLSCNAAQCGICTPGMLMAGLYYCQGEARLPGEDAREALAGNLCRCTGYESILQAMDLVLLKSEKKTPASKAGKAAAKKTQKQAARRSPVASRTARKTAKKKAAAKKTAVKKKASAKKASAKKASAKKASAKKAAAKKAAAKKAAAKKAAAKKTAAKKTAAKKTAAKKTAAKKTAAKKTAARKTAAKKTAAKKTAAKTVRKPAKKTAAKTVRKPAQKTAAKKLAKKVTTRKTVAKKAARQPTRRGGRR